MKCDAEHNQGGLAIPPGPPTTSMERNHHGQRKVQRIEALALEMMGQGEAAKAKTFWN